MKFNNLLHDSKVVIPKVIPLTGTEITFFGDSNYTDKGAGFIQVNESDSITQSVTLFNVNNYFYCMYTQIEFDGVLINSTGTAETYRYFNIDVFDNEYHTIKFITPLEGFPDYTIRNIGSVVTKTYMDDGYSNIKQIKLPDGEVFDLDNNVFPYTQVKGSQGTVAEVETDNENGLYYIKQYMRGISGVDSNIKFSVNNLDYVRIDTQIPGDTRTIEGKITSYTEYDDTSLNFICGYSNGASDRMSVGINNGYIGLYFYGQDIRPNNLGIPLSSLTFPLIFKAIKYADGTSYLEVNGIVADKYVSGYIYSGYGIIIGCTYADRLIDFYAEWFKFDDYKVYLNERLEGNLVRGDSGYHTITTSHADGQLYIDNEMHLAVNSNIGNDRFMLEGRTGMKDYAKKDILIITNEKFHNLKIGAKYIYDDTKITDKIVSYGDYFGIHLNSRGYFYAYFFDPASTVSGGYEPKYLYLGGNNNGDTVNRHMVVNHDGTLVTCFEDGVNVGTLTSDNPGWILRTYRINHISANNGFTIGRNFNNSVETMFLQHKVIEVYHNDETYGINEGEGDMLVGDKGGRMQIYSDASIFELWLDMMKTYVSNSILKVSGIVHKYISMSVHVAQGITKYIIRKSAGTDY